MAQKILMNQIEPFNDIYYRSCIYNSIFPVIRCNKKSFYPFFANDITRYGSITSKYGNIFGVEYIEDKPIVSVLEDLGLQVEESDPDASRVKEVVIESIRYQKPVVLWIDVYYATIRKETYQKLHTPHTWLIYGFDEYDELFHIIEHEHLGNLCYKKRTVPFKDLVNCYEEYLKQYKDFYNISPLYSLSNQGENMYETYAMSDYAALFCENMKRNTDSLKEGVVQLELFLRELKTVMNDASLLEEKAEMYLEIVNQIMNEKKLDQYKLELLMPNQWNDLFAEILDILSKVRMELYKYSLTHRYKADRFQAITPYLDTLALLEKKYIDFFQ